MITKVEVRIEIDEGKKEFEGGDIDRVIAEVDSYLASYRALPKDGKSWFSAASS